MNIENKARVALLNWAEGKGHAIDGGNDLYDSLKEMVDSHNDLYEALRDLLRVEDGDWAYHSAAHWESIAMARKLLKKIEAKA